MLKMGYAYMNGKLSKSQSSPDKPRTKARRRVAMVLKPEMVLLAACCGRSCYIELSLVISGNGAAPVVALSSIVISLSI